VAGHWAAPGMTERPTQHHDGQALLLEIDPKDTPGLVGMEGTELLDFLDVDGGLRVEAEFGRVVSEGDVLHIVRADRPVEFVAQIRHQLREGLDATKAADVSGRHGSIQFHPALQDRLDPNGRLQPLEVGVSDVPLHFQPGAPQPFAARCADAFGVRR
jgi:hypothetical protein